MLVTSIEEVTKNRYKVFLDEQFAFALYKGELSRFHIRVGQEVTLEDYESIRGEVIQKRAKKRVLHLLDQMPRTEQQLRVKMRQNFYTEDIIDGAIAYAKGFGYINDYNYVHLYVQDKIKSKSRKEINCLLMQKGIERDVIVQALDEIYGEENEIDAIRKLARKKRYEEHKEDRKEREKVLGYLLRKGFSYDDICVALEEYE